jgi:hypothetical protein
MYKPNQTSSKRWLDRYILKKAKTSYILEQREYLITSVHKNTIQDKL